jgi:hypothetical protein
MDQQLRLGRIVLAAVDAPHQTISVDIVFEGNAIRRGFEYYGVWRDANERAICPFVLNDDGTVDFGTSYNGEDRVYEFGIFEGPVGLGHEIGWRSGEYETRMKITGISQLV